MTPGSWLAAVTAALAVLAFVPARGALALGRARRRRVPRRGALGPWLAGRPARWASALLAGGAVAVLVGGAAGVMVAVVATAGAVVALEQLARRRSPSGGDGLLARRFALAADLLASVVDAGVGLPTALSEVAAALPGPVGSALERAHRLGAVGAVPSHALVDLAQSDLAGRLGRSLLQAQETGMPPVPVLRAAAARQRDRSRSHALRRARGAGSRAALPVGLCFLPAFVLVGVVPVVVAGFGQAVGG
jgi:Flp pilus assembly protein TadB